MIRNTSSARKQVQRFLKSRSLSSLIAAKSFLRPLKPSVLATQRPFQRLGQVAPLSSSAHLKAENISLKYQEFGQFITNELGEGTVEKFHVSLSCY